MIDLQILSVWSTVTKFSSRNNPWSNKNSVIEINVFVCLSPEVKTFVGLVLFSEKESEEEDSFSCFEIKKYCKTRGNKYFTLETIVLFFDNVEKVVYHLRQLGQSLWFVVHDMAKFKI